MSKKKLLAEVELTLKKCVEGLSNYDDIYNKIECAASNQRERFHLDLKQEIKRLQKHRENVKNWCSSDTIKEKTDQLRDCKQEIEYRMESFRKIERQTKTKAFSKEALRAAREEDEKPQLSDEQMEHKEWLEQQIETLRQQSGEFEEQVERISSAGRGKRKKKSKEHEDESSRLAARIERNKWHLAQLEQCVAAMARIEPGLVDEIKDDVEYYVNEAFDDPHYQPFDDLYLMVLHSENDNDSNEDEQQAVAVDGDAVDGDAVNVDAVDVVDDDDDDEDEDDDVAPHTKKQTHQAQAKTKTTTTVEVEDDEDQDVDLQVPMTSEPRASKTKKKSHPDKKDKESSSQKTNSKKKKRKTKKQPASVDKQSTSSKSRHSRKPKSSPSVSSVRSDVSNSTTHSQTLMTTHLQSMRLPPTMDASSSTVSIATTITLAASNVERQQSLASVVSSTSSVVSATAPATAVTATATGNNNNNTHHNHNNNTMKPNSNISQQLLQQPLNTLSTIATIHNASRVKKSAAVADTTTTTPTLAAIATNGNTHHTAPTPTPTPTPTSVPVPSTAAAPAPIPTQQHRAATVAYSESSSSSSHVSQSQRTKPPKHHNQNHTNNNNSSSGGGAIHAQTTPATSAPTPSTIAQAVQPAPPAQVQAPPPSSNHELPPFARTLTRTERHVLDIISLSFEKRPQPMDTFEPSSYVPEQPFATPRFFPKERKAAFDGSNVFALMDLDSLFFVFYFQTASFAQFMAAKELKVRGWSFHEHYNAWFQRHYSKRPPSASTTNESSGDAGEHVPLDTSVAKDSSSRRGESGEGIAPAANECRSLFGKGQHWIDEHGKYERGTYIFFDRNKSWQMRMRESFKFEYKHLEDEHCVNVDDKLAWDKLATYGNGCGLIKGEIKKTEREQMMPMPPPPPQLTPRSSKAPTMQVPQSKSHRTQQQSGSSSKRLLAMQSSTSTSVPTRPPSASAAAPPPPGRFRPPIHHRQQYQSNHAGSNVAAAMNQYHTR